MYINPLHGVRSDASHATTRDSGDEVTLLNQIIAVEKGVKASADRALTDAYHAIQRTPQLSGIARTYTPKDDDGDRLPPESTLVQIKVDDVIETVTGSLTRLFDVTLTKDDANCTARGDVVVDGQTILADVPVTYLLFLEKKLGDMHTFIAKLPTLDPAEQWSYDPNAGTYATDPVETTRTKKVPRNHVKAEATDKHPAQVEVYHEDVIVGTWKTVKFSGAIPATRQRELLERVAKLGTAVKFAREQANTQQVTDRSAGAAILGYLFG